MKKHVQDCAWRAFSFCQAKGGEEAYSGSEECLQIARRIRGQGGENVHAQSAPEFVQLLKEKDIS